MLFSITRLLVSSPKLMFFLGFNDLIGLERGWIELDFWFYCCFSFKYITIRLFPSVVRCLLLSKLHTKPFQSYLLGSRNQFIKSYDICSRHDITEKLLELMLSTLQSINQSINQSKPIFFLGQLFWDIFD
jgi:hypothetical protein